MGSPPRHVRLTDVAQAAGVHTSTASRVLNGDPDLSVRPETTARILAAAERYGYQPNALARALRRSRTGSIGMVIPLLRNPIWTRLQSGAVRRAEERGYVVMVLEESLDSGRQPADYRYLVDESRVDGLLLATAIRGGRAKASDPGVRHVFVNRRGPRPGNDVVMDEGAAVGLIVDAALRHGHRSIALLDGPREIDTVHRRVDAVSTRCAEAGIDLEVVHAAPSEEGGFDATAAVVRSGATLCAVGSLNQLFGVAAGLRHHGIDVPGRMSLLSLDEDECLAYFDPPVTAVSMPLAELGAAAVDALVARIEGPAAGDVVVTDPIALVERASVAPPTA